MQKKNDINFEEIERVRENKISLASNNTSVIQPSIYIDLLWAAYT